MPRFVHLFAAGAIAMAAAAGAEAAPQDPCAVGTWQAPGTAQPLDPRALIAGLAARPVVLLGENHADAEHHRWQLHTIAALHALNPDMVLGFEMFPRDRQPVLDAWVEGELAAEAFLERVGWDAVWGFDADLYLPLFHFARQNRVPMVALNVERALVGRVARDGWGGIPVAERAGVGDPAPPSEAYLHDLAQVFALKRRLHGGEPAGAASGREITAAEVAAARSDPGFARFVEAQVLWDRAMAEALAAAREATGAPLAVGVVGRGHAEHGWGIPHQLRDLGIADAAVLLPVSGPDACRTLVAGAADAAFVLDSRVGAAKPRARLGVVIETADGGARIVDVLAGSVAAAAGVEAGDVVTAAAGRTVTSNRELIAIIRRQAPGTWLPLQVRRDGAERQVVARFPATFDAAP